LYEELQGSINGCPRGSLSLFSDRSKELLGLEVVVPLEGLLEDDISLGGELEPSGDQEISEYPLFYFHMVTL
jgi:hypothetical protein